VSMMKGGALKLFFRTEPSEKKGGRSVGHIFKNIIYRSLNARYWNCNTVWKIV
jgi:hypothetical protein